MAGPWEVVSEAPASGGKKDTGWDVVEEKPATAAPTLWDRAKVNAREGLDNTSTGEVINYNASGQGSADRAAKLKQAIDEAETAKSPVGLETYGQQPGARGPAEVSPHGGLPLQKMRDMLAEELVKGDANKDAYAKTLAVHKAEAEAVPSWTAEPSLIGKAIAGVTALAGQAVGGLAGPENLIGGAGPKVVRAVGESAASHIARDMAAGGIENAVAGSVANPAVQEGRVARGEQDAFDPLQTLESAGMGFGLGAGLRGAHAGAKGVVNALRREAPVPVPAVEPKAPDLLQLPAPGRGHLTDDEIALQRAAMERGNRPTVETPPKVYGSETRQPQTSDGLVSQDQAAEAFKLAKAQSERAGPTVADTQPAGRPEGVGQTPVHLDEGHPVDIIDRRMVPDAQGRITEVATVRRYDPSTGDHDLSGPVYDVPVKQLEVKQYAKDPRQAQDFADRAQGPTPPEMPRQPGRGAPEREADQTYRQTPPDDNATGTARARRPEQPEGPHPGKPWSTAEEAVRDFQAREKEAPSEPPPAGNKYENAKATNKAAPVDRDGRFVVDEDGHVMSTGKAPMRFKDQMQAGKWIMGVGQKQSPDQIFEIANHPAGKGGFSVRERGRSEAPASPQADAAHAETSPQTGPQRLLGGPAVAAEVPFSQRVRDRADEVIRENQGDKLKKDGTPDRRGYWHTGNEDQVNRVAMETARHDVMVSEAKGAIDEARARDGLNDSDLGEISHHYHQRPGETPDEAFHTAADKWFAKTKADAIAFEREHEIEMHGLDEAEPAHDTASHEEDMPFESSTREADSGRSSEGDGVRGEGEGEPGSGPAPDEAGAEAPHGSEHVGGEDFATDDGPDGGRQTVIPGAERKSAPDAGGRTDGLRGGDEPPPKGGLFDDDARNQSDIFDPKDDDVPRRPDGTFYSNPFASPEAWKSLGHTLGMTKSYWRDLGASRDNLLEAWRKDDPKKTWGSADLARTIFYSTDGEIRSIGKAYDSPTIKALADHLFAPGDFGRGGAVPRTYHEEIGARVTSNLNKLADIMKPFLGKEHAATVQQIKRLVQNPGNIKPGTKIHDAAAGLRKLLDEEFKYLKSSGVDVGHVDGYWPRMVDSVSTLRDQSGFLAAAAKQYLRDGIAKTRNEADDMANSWLASIELGHAGAKKDGTDFVMLGGTPNSSFAKERVFSDSIERDKSNPLNRFYLQDPVDTLTQHFQRTARRAAWASRFGDDLSKWKDMKAAIIKEGNAASLRQVVDIVGSATGVVRSYNGAAATNAMAIMRTWGALRLLPRAAVTSLSEMAIPAIRNGNIARILPDIARTAYALVGGMKKERALAEDVGVISRVIGDSILGRRYGAMQPGSKFQQDIMNRNFRRTGLEQFTTATRVMSINAGQTLIRRLALDVADGHMRAKSSTAMLRELGVSDVPAFSKWLKATNEGRPSVVDLKSDVGVEREYRTALQRHNNQTILDPNSSTRPGWANHPLGSLVFMLQSYQYAFQKNVLNRAGAGIVEGLTGKGYNLADRATMLAPAMALPMLAAIQYAIAPIRDEIWGDPSAKASDPDAPDPMMKELMGANAPSARVMKAISRGSLTGMVDPYFNMLTGARYDRDAATAVAGPQIGAIFQILDKTMKLGVKNPTTTNSTERDFTKNMYDMAVAPAIAAGAAFLPAPIGAAVTHYGTSATAREGFTSAVEGPKRTTGSNGPPRAPGPPKPGR